MLLHNITDCNHALKLSCSFLLKFVDYLVQLQIQGIYMRK